MNLYIGGKIVFISGSSRGIGLATAIAFLEEGAYVIINGRNEEKLKQIIGDLKQKYSTRISYIASDIVKDGGQLIYKYISDKFGKLDIFIANIGSGKPEKNEMLDIGEIKRFYDVNLCGNVDTLSKVYPLLLKGNNPSVVFVSSIVAKEVLNAPVGYAASKASVITMSKYLSKIWADNSIRVNCVLPGNVLFSGGRWEELIEEDPDGVENYILSNVPMNRFGKPEEIADAILFLASKRASFITGATLTIDGGQTSII